MSVPAADNLRRWPADPADQIEATKVLEAIDALADPFTDEPPSYEDAIGRLIAIYDLLHPTEGD